MSVPPRRGSDGEITPEAKARVEALLRQSFRPEFLNRLDEIVFYKPLARGDVEQIVELMIAELNQRLSQRGLRCVLTPEAKEKVIADAYDPLYGARPLRRYLQHTVETLVSRAIIAGKTSQGDTLTVDVVNGELSVEEKQVLRGEVVEDK